MRNPALLLLFLAVPLGAQTPADPPRPPGFILPDPAPLVHHSAPGSMALGPSGRTLYVANEGSESLSVMRLRDGIPEKVAEIALQGEPCQVAVTPDGKRIFVTLRRADQLAVIDGATNRLLSLVPVGGEPIGLVLDHQGLFAYTANFSSSTVSFVDTKTLSVGTIGLPPDSFPFAIAAGRPVPGADEKIFVTDLFAHVKPNTRPGPEGDTDDGRVGRVSVISSLRKILIAQVDLSPIATGFDSDRTAFGGPAKNPTMGFPNQLLGITVRDRWAFVTSVGASPQGPVNFTTNTQSFVHVLDTETFRELKTAHINMNAAVARERPAGLFLNTPWGMAFGPGKNWGYALSAASDVAIKIKTRDGFIGIDGPVIPQSRAGILRIDVGKNPRHVLFDGQGQLAYVHNHIGRSITVIDSSRDAVVATVQATELPVAGTKQASVLHGEELFNTSKSRMSTNGWGSCFSCHPFGWSDTVVWSFPSGPRKSLPMIATFSDPEPRVHRVLNWSAIFDEVADFELNIRTVSSNPSADGQTGLIQGPRADIPPLTPRANSGRSPDWQDIENYVRNIRSPRGAFTPAQAEPGKRLFSHLGCVRCHGGPLWSASTRFFTPPPVVAQIPIVDGQLAAFLIDVATFLPGEVTSNNQPARGALGFNPPSLQGAWAFPPYFHNGRALTLEEAMIGAVRDVAHADLSAGRAITDGELRELAIFLRTIDDTTPLQGPR